MYGVDFNRGLIVNNNKHDVVIKQTENNVEVTIDGNPVSNITDIVYRHEATEIPNLMIEMAAVPEIHMACAVDFSFTPTTVKSAIQVFQSAFLNDRELYNALVASIYSALRDAEKGNVQKGSAAQMIADRILGKN